MTTTNTQGAAIARYKIGYHADEWGQRSSTPSGIPDASGSWVLYADHVTALAAGQATAAQLGAYAALSESFLEIPDVQDESGINTYYSREVVLECIDAALASHGQAQAGEPTMPQPAPQQEAHHLAQALTDRENQPNQYGVEFGMSGTYMHFKIGNQLFKLAYEPDEREEFDFMKRMLVNAFTTFTHGVKTAHGDELSDAVRVPLYSLHADAAYLIGRLRDGSMPYVRVIEIIRERIDAAKAAIRARSAQGDALDAARWHWLSEHIQVAWDEGKFTSLVRIVSEQHRQSLNASVDRMMAGDWSDADAARAAQAAEPVARYEYNGDLDAWFITYSNNPKAKTRQLVFGDTAPQPVAREPLSHEQQIAESLRKFGLTLVKTASGYDVLELGKVVAHGIKGGQHGTE